MIFNMIDCGGCRTCELACSFYHVKEFNPLMSSIKIIDKNGEVGFFVEFVEDNACDGCRENNNQPMCLEFCSSKDTLRKYITEFVSK